MSRAPATTPQVASPSSGPAPAASGVAAAQDTLGNAAMAEQLGLASGAPGTGGSGAAAPPGAPARPTSLTAGTPVRVDEISPELASDLLDGAGERVLWETALGSPEEVTTDLLGRHIATMDEGGAMTLPALDAGVAEGVESADALGDRIGRREPVTRIVARPQGRDVAIEAQVNPLTLLLIITAAAFLAALGHAIETYRTRHVDVPNAQLPPQAVQLGRLPILPPEHRWRDDGQGGAQAQRRANAPDSGLQAEAVPLGGGSVAARTSIADGPSPTGRRPIGTVAPTRAPTYGGARNYPMSNDDYEGQTSGERYGRGHLIDHADGTAATTADRRNYVPQTEAFNEGLRNHAVRGARSNGGGVYDERDRYGQAPERTQDGSAVPERIDFGVFPNNGQARAWSIPNDDQQYGTSRSVAAANGFEMQNPQQQMQAPPIVQDDTLQRLMTRLLVLGVATLALIWSLWSSFGS